MSSYHFSCVLFINGLHLCNSTSSIHVLKKLRSSFLFYFLQIKHKINLNKLMSKIDSFGTVSYTFHCIWIKYWFWCFFMIQHQWSLNQITFLNALLQYYPLLFSSNAKISLVSSLFVLKNENLSRQFRWFWWPWNFFSKTLSFIIQDCPKSQKISVYIIQLEWRLKFLFQ